MLALHNRQEVEALTYHEVLALLRERELEHQDDRTWQLSLKSDRPVETYEEITERIEQALEAADEPSIEEHPMKDWFRAT